MKSPVYWNSAIYRACLHVLFGFRWNEHMKRIAKEIGGLSVLDLCCGDCKLRDFLENKKDYLGYDFNDSFVNNARKRGINAEHRNIIDFGWEKKDCVVMSDALYHFHGDADKIIVEMISTAGKRVVVSEPIVNLSSSKNPLISFFGKLFSSPQDGQSGEKRFCEEELGSIFRRHGAKKIFRSGRDLVGVFEKE